MIAIVSTFLLVFACFPLFSSANLNGTVEQSKTSNVTDGSFKFESNIDYLYHYSTDVHIDHKIWSETTHVHDHRHSDAAFHLYARLNISSVWQNSKGDQHLLKLEIDQARFINRTHTHSLIDCLALNVLTKYPSVFFWDDGIVSRVYFNENDNAAAINFKKGIISLFQYKQDNATETDSLGKCQTSYRTHENRFIKDKHFCSNVRYPDEFSGAKKELNYSMNFQSTCSYNFENSTIKSAACSDMIFPQLILPEVAGFRIVSRLSADLIETVANEKSPLFTSAEAAIKSIFDLTPDQFHFLETEKQVHPCDDYCDRFEDFINDHKKFLTRKFVADREGTNVFLSLISLARRQNEPLLTKVLEKSSNEIRFTLIEAFLSAQTNAPVNAVYKYLDQAMTGKNKVEIIEKVLLSSAFVPRPSEFLTEKILERMSKFVAIDQHLEQSCFLALGAIAHRIADLNPKSTFLEKFTKLLESRTKKSLVYLSIYNAKLETHKSMLVDEIRRCNETNLCWLALNALSQYEPDKYSEQIVDILRSIYHGHNEKMNTNLEIRQLAGQLLLRTDISIGDLTNLILSALDKSNHQLAAFIWRLISTMAEKHDLLYQKLKYIEKRGFFKKTYDTLAHKGQSDYYRRPLVETFGFGIYYTISQLLSKSGALRESEFKLDIEPHEGKKPLNLFSFGLSATGLDSYLSDNAKDSESPDEHLQAQLRINLLNMQLRPVVLFDGVTGLMSAVWSAPTELTSAFQSNIMIHDLSHYIHLHNGLVIHYEAQSAVSIDLAGMASASLWNKNSNSVIRVSSAFSVHSHVDVLNDFVLMGINVTVGTNGVVDYKTDIDYADTPIKVCMQMNIHSFDVHDNIQNFYALKRAKSVRWSANRTRHYPGYDYPFTSKNDVMCRELLMM